nr:urease accessory protein UreF [Sporomusa ovata]
MNKPSLQAGLRLMQLADSAFPSGSFTQSFGMETFIQRGDIKNEQQLTTYMQTYLYYIWRLTDLLAVKLAWQAAGMSSMNKLAALDKRLHAMKLPYESREGSVKMGKRLRQILNEIDPSYQLDSKLPWCHHAIVFGHYGAMGMELAPLLAAYAHATVVSLVANGVRVIPLGQTSGQQVITQLQPLVEQCINWVLAATEQDWGGSAPAFDWAGMAHECLYSRIFMS